MAQIGKIKEIIEIKNHLEKMKNDGYIKEWEIPYENILTRLSAAIFFLTPFDDSYLDNIWNQLSRYENFSYTENKEKKLSQLKYRIQFKNENNI